MNYIKKEQQIFMFEIIYNVYNILQNKKNVKFYFVRLFLIVKYCIVDNIENEIVDMCCHFTR